VLFCNTLPKYCAPWTPMLFRSAYNIVSVYIERWKSNSIRVIKKFLSLDCNLMHQLDILPLGYRYCYCWYWAQWVSIWKIQYQTNNSKIILLYSSLTQELHVGISDCQFSRLPNPMLWMPLKIKERWKIKLYFAAVYLKSRIIVNNRIKSWADISKWKKNC
jgi:hypothetical protein